MWIWAEYKKTEAANAKELTQVPRYLYVSYNRLVTRGLREDTSSQTAQIRPARVRKMIISRIPTISCHSYCLNYLATIQVLLSGIIKQNWCIQIAVSNQVIEF